MTIDLLAGLSTEQIVYGIAFLVGVYLSHFQHNKKFVLGFVFLCVIVQGVAAYMNPDAYIYNGTPDLGTLVFIVAGMQGLFIGAIEISIGKAKDGTIMNQAMFDRGYHTFMTSLLIVGCGFLFYFLGAFAIYVALAVHP